MMSDSHRSHGTQPPSLGPSFYELLRRTYDIDTELCERCGATMRPVAVILDPKVAQQILDHIGQPSESTRFTKIRAPP